MQMSQGDQKEQTEKQEKEFSEKIKNYSFRTLAHDRFSYFSSRSFSARLALLYLVIGLAFLFYWALSCGGLGRTLCFLDTFFLTYVYPGIDIVFAIKFFPGEHGLQYLGGLFMTAAIIYAVFSFFERLVFYKIFRRYPLKGVRYPMLTLLLLFGLLILLSPILY